MFVRYGTYTHATNEVGFKLTDTPLRSQGGVLYAIRQLWQCRGDLLNYESQAAITAAIRAIELAYQQDGGDLVFLEDDGETVTGHALYSANCIGGTRIVQAPCWGDTYGSGEYQPGYGRSYTLAVQGDIALTNANVTLEFEETLSSTGTGGPTDAWLLVAQGAPFHQQPSSQSTYRITQSGHAVGLYGPPGVPYPIYPANELQALRSIKSDTPKLYGAFHWPVSWSYTFEGTGLSGGEPSPYPNE